MAELTKDDMATLAPSKPVNDNIINEFLRLIEVRSRQETKAKKVLCMNTNFFSRWDQNNVGYQGVKSWIKENPFIMDIVFFPVFIPGQIGHWILIVARPKKRDIVCFDSLGGAHNRRMKQVKEFFENESLRRKRRFANDEWSTLNMLGNTPQQNKDSNDCGIFVCLIADLLAREKPIRSLRGLTSAELRDSVRRKLKWTGVSKTKPEQQKKEAKIILRKVDTTHTTTASKNTEETLSAGNIFTPNEVDRATAYLETILSSNRSPATPDPLLTELDEFVYPFPKESPDASSGFEEALAKMGIKTPPGKDPVTSNDSILEVRGIEPLTKKKMDVDPPPPEPTVHQEVEPAPTSSSKPSGKADPLRTILSVRRKRGKTKRQRVFLEDGSFIRMNSKKIQTISKHYPKVDLRKINKS
ncbi:SUMO1 sentrin specific peptidase 1 [Homalodisca vitripennis]|nr:SUMO1 sentrin specific peptidase 1 [Homalodisca vitripennis]